MTVEEFKTKYPHLAHLEGNALWDAMAKAVFIESGSKVIETEEELIKVLREKFTDDLTFEERFKNFGILIPMATNDQGVPHVEYKQKETDTSKMSFDELAEWAKNQQHKSKNKKR